MYRKFFQNLITIITICLFITNCTIQEKPLGSKENPIKIYFMPGENQEKVSKSAEILKNFLEKDTNYSINAIVSSDYISIIEGFGHKKVDIAFINTFGYLLTNDCCRAEAYLKVLRGKNIKSYKGEIITHKDSGIKKIEDLNGKTIAFTNQYSTAGFILPLKLFQDKKIKPGKTVFAQWYNKVIMMVYNREVDAGAVYYEPPENGNIKDARSELLDQFPDIEQKVIILTTTDEVPNNPIAFRKDLPEEIKTRMIGAFIKFVRTNEGLKALKDTYDITGFDIAKDSDYNSVRNILQSLGKDVEDLVPGGFKIYAQKNRFQTDIP